MIISYSCNTYDNHHALLKPSPPQQPVSAASKCCRESHSAGISNDSSMCVKGLPCDTNLTVKVVASHPYLLSLRTPQWQIFFTSHVSKKPTPLTIIPVLLENLPKPFLEFKQGPAIPGCSVNRVCAAQSAKSMVPSQLPHTISIISLGRRTATTLEVPHRTDLKGDTTTISHWSTSKRLGHRVTYSCRLSLVTGMFSSPLVSLVTLFSHRIVRPPSTRIQALPSPRRPPARVHQVPKLNRA